MIFHRLQLEAFCHATEDVAKVKEAVLNVLPSDMMEKAEFTEQKTEGSFGNEILILRLEYEKQGDMRKIIENIRQRIPKDDLSEFDIEEHVSDDSEVWLLFDKQEAYKGKLSLDGRDTIQLRGKIATFPASRKKAVEMMLGLWS